MSIRVPVKENCAFCQYLDGTRDCAFIRRTAQVSSFVNLRQYERGALLVIPNVHRATALDMEPHLLGEVHNEAALMGRALVRAFGATGLNIFQNNGVDGGQSEPHYHVHVVPRYPGSDPQRIFSSKDFSPVPMIEQRAVASEISRVIGDPTTSWTAP